jgi:hypothetical protein
MYLRPRSRGLRNTPSKWLFVQPMEQNERIKGFTQAAIFYTKTIICFIEPKSQGNIHQSCLEFKKKTYLKNVAML